MTHFSSIVRATALALCSLAAVASTGAADNKPSDDEIRKLLIRASIALYPGSCPCPYSKMSNGQVCGNTSAYRTRSGTSVLCYSGDVTPRMIKAWRQQPDS